MLPYASFVTNDIFCLCMFTEYPIKKLYFLHVLLKVSWHVPILFHMKDYVSNKKKLASFQLSSANFYGLFWSHTCTAVVPCFRFFCITKLSKMSNISFYGDFQIMSFQQKMISNEKFCKCYTTWLCSDFFLAHLPVVFMIFCICHVSHFPCILKPLYFIKNCSVHKKKNLKCTI